MIASLVTARACGAAGSRRPVIRTHGGYSPKRRGPTKGFRASDVRHSTDKKRDRRRCATLRGRRNCD